MGKIAKEKDGKINVKTIYYQTQITDLHLNMTRRQDRGIDI